MRCDFIHSVLDWPILCLQCFFSGNNTTHVPFCFCSLRAFGCSCLKTQKKNFASTKMGAFTTSKPSWSFMGEFWGACQPSTHVWFRNTYISAVLLACCAIRFELIWSHHFISSSRLNCLFYLAISLAGRRKEPRCGVELKSTNHNQLSKASNLLSWLQ